MSSEALFHFCLKKSTSGERCDRAIFQTLSQLDHLDGKIKTLLSIKKVKFWLTQEIICSTQEITFRPSDRIRGNEAFVINLTKLTETQDKRDSYSLINPKARGKTGRDQKNLDINSSNVEASYKDLFWQQVWLSAQQPNIKSIKVIYETDQLLVINKPINIPTAPTLDAKRESLFHQALKYLYQKSNISSDLNIYEMPYLRCLHRLDLATSGVVVMSKTKLATKVISQLISQREIEKYYYVVCQRPNSGPLCQLITQGEQSSLTSFPQLPLEDKNLVFLDQLSPLIYPIYDYRTLMKKISTPQQGKTKWITTKKGGLFSHSEIQLLGFSDKLIYLKVQIHTGRTHQIRVHLQSLGAPIIGDAHYGGTAAKRLHLHAAQLSLPINKVSTSLHSYQTGLPLTLMAPLPPSII